MSKIKYFKKRNQKKCGEELSKIKKNMIGAIVKKSYNKYLYRNFHQIIILLTLTIVKIYNKIKKQYKEDKEKNNKTHSSSRVFI